jgi:hypothetical protein
VQVFLPSTDFITVAACLDRQRLNKQALEAWQIMMCNVRLDPAGNDRPGKGWSHHPAVKMWRGHEFALLDYIGAMVGEWQGRGYRSSIYDKAQATFYDAVDLGRVGTVPYYPSWFYTHGEAVASTHRVALLSKNYEWYSQFGWPEDTGTRPESYEYLWCDAPTK